MNTPLKETMGNQRIFSSIRRAIKLSPKIEQIMLTNKDFEALYSTIPPRLLAPSYRKELYFNGVRLVRQEVSKK